MKYLSYIQVNHRLNLKPHIWYSIENGITSSTPICVSPPCLIVTYGHHGYVRAHCTLPDANLMTVLPARLRKRSTPLTSYLPTQSRADWSWYVVLVVLEPPTLRQTQTRIHGNDAGHEAMGCRYGNRSPRTTVNIKGMSNWERIHTNKFDRNEIVTLWAQSRIQICAEFCFALYFRLRVENNNTSSLYKMAAIFQNTTRQDGLN